MTRLNFLTIGLVAASFAFGAGNATAQEPLFKTKISDEAKEQIAKEKAQAAADRRAKRRAAAEARRKKRAVRTTPRKVTPKVVPLDAAERSSVVNRFVKCYKPARVLTRNGEANVEIVVKLSPEGFLTSSPLLLRTNTDLDTAETAYAAARKALFSCQPYVLPVAKYADWKEVNLILNKNTVELR